MSEINYASLDLSVHPYTARLIPSIPRRFINKLSKPGDTILDPFCGSGTCLLEAVLLKRNAIGIDINPLAALISKVLTTYIDINELKWVINFIKKNLKQEKNEVLTSFPNIDYWFCETAQRELSQIKYLLFQLEEKVNKDTYNFLLIIFSSIIRRSSYADPGIAKTYKSKFVKNRISDGWIPTPKKYYLEILEKNYKKKKLINPYLNSKYSTTKVYHSNSKDLRYILNGEIERKFDLIITSPPYINAQDYFRSYKHEIFWLELATPEEVMSLNNELVGTEAVNLGSYEKIPKSKFRNIDILLEEIWKINRKKSYIVHTFFKSMTNIINEFNKLLSKDGHLCIIIGNNTICNIEVKTHEHLITIAESVGFKCNNIYIDSIQSRFLSPVRNHSGGFIKEEQILIFTK